jgi:hypothetical protein
MSSTAFDLIKSSVCISGSTWPLKLINSYQDLLIDKAIVGNGFLALDKDYDWQCNL